MITLSPVELLLRVSSSSYGAQEIGNNAGRYVEHILSSTGNKVGDAWCAAQVSKWGRDALKDQWPMPNTASVMTICNWALEKQIRYRITGVDEGQPMIGDLYALWFESMQRWAHIGLVVGVKAGTLSIIARDGNTSDPGNTDPKKEREGWLVIDKPRVLSDKDRLIRWWKLLE